MSKPKHATRSFFCSCTRALGAGLIGIGTAALFVLPAQAQGAAGNAQTLSRLMHAAPSKATVRLSPVREAALEASARALGVQTGLIEYAQEIKRVIDSRSVQMERAFRFGDLVIGQGVLPPVILDTKNAVSVTDDTMRLAGAIYTIKQPARFFTGAPSWRDWLLMGLPVSEELPQMPDNEQLLPRDEKERAYWQQKISEAYASGREQAREIFDHNLSMLEQTYIGMRTFYDLYQRNMVSAPIIAKSQEIVTQEDPNTIIVGDTLFRITMPTHFLTNPAAWRALQALPSTKPLLPVGQGFDPEQVRHAYSVYQSQMIARAQKEGKLPPTPAAAPSAKPAGAPPAQAVRAPQVRTTRPVSTKPAPAPAPKAKPSAVQVPAPLRAEPIKTPANTTPAAPTTNAAPAAPIDTPAKPLFSIPSQRAAK